MIPYGIRTHSYRDQGVEKPVYFLASSLSSPLMISLGHIKCGEPRFAMQLVKNVLDSGNGLHIWDGFLV